MSLSRNGLLAVVFFTIYLLLYGGFMLINVLAPELMELTPLAGVNLAIWYGFGLILAAVVLAFLYGMLCLTPEKNEASRTSTTQTQGGQK